MFKIILELHINDSIIFSVENYRSSLKDTAEALKINGKHMKAILRGFILVLMALGIGK